MKEETESQSTLENSRMKDEPIENSQQRSVIEEPGSPSTLEDTRMKGEPVINIEQKSVKEEPERQDDYNQFTTKKNDSDNTSDISSISPKGPPNIIEKRDYAEFSGHAKPFAKETERQHISPVKKRSKGANDKQPTIFSYFGRS